MKQSFLRPMAVLTFLVYGVGLFPNLSLGASAPDDSAEQLFYDSNGLKKIQEADANAKKEIETCTAARGIADEINVAHNQAIQQMPADSAMRTDCTQTAKKIIGLGESSANQKGVMDKCVAGLKKAYSKCESAKKNGENAPNQQTKKITGFSAQNCDIGLKAEEGLSQQKSTALGNATVSSHKAADNLTNGNKAIGSVGCVQEGSKDGLNKLLAGLAGAAAAAGLVSALKSDDEEDDDSSSSSTASNGTSGGSGTSFSSAGSIPSTTWTNSSSSDVAIPDSLLSTEITSAGPGGNTTDSTPSSGNSPLVIKPADVATTEGEIVSGRGTSNSSASSNAALAATSSGSGSTSGGSGGSGSISTGSGNNSFIGASDSSGSGGSGGRSLGSVGRYSTSGGDDSSSGGGSKNTNDAGMNENLLIRPKFKANANGSGWSTVGAVGNGRAAQLERDADCAKNPDAARCKAGQSVLSDPLLGGSQ